MTEQWTEVVVFMHGITPEEHPGSHHGDYSQLFENIKQSLAGYSEKPKLFDRPIEVEWGYLGSQSQGEDEFLAQAELTFSTAPWRRSRTSTTTRLIRAASSACFGPSSGSC